MAVWVRFRAEGREWFGAVEDGQITPYSGEMFGQNEALDSRFELSAVELLAPCAPRTFIGLWNNFHELAVKFGFEKPAHPLWFIKAPGALLDPGGTIRRPAGYSGRILYEGELGIVIGRQCSNVDEDEAAAAIFGYTCINDVTASEWLATPAFPQWARAKGCDTFGPVGPCIATGLDWSALRIRSRLNGRERQDYAASDMILPPARIVSLLSREMTLVPGDLIACGTSLGALPMRPGDRIEIEIEGIGILANTLEEEVD